MDHGALTRRVAALAGPLRPPRRGEASDLLAVKTGGRILGVPTFHHANLGVLGDGLEAETSWLVDVLGYRQIEVTPDWPASGPYWFEADDGSQIHLSVDAEHRPTTRAHLAVAFEELVTVRQRLDRRGLPYELTNAARSRS